MNIQVVSGGVVVNSILLPDTATIAADGASASWPGGGAFDAPEGSTLFVHAGASIGWTLAGGVLSAPSAPAPSLAALQAATIAAAQAAGAAIVADIYPTPSTETAFQNAALIVRSCGNAAPPSSDPDYALFNSVAASYGLSPAAFAALVAVSISQSLALKLAEGALSAAVAAATSAAGIAAALATFETALGAVVTALNAALPAPIAAPAAIVIVGVNG